MAACAPCRAGSSPLTRGKRRLGLCSLATGRLIPAHAGKTRGCASLRGLFRAHPRSRGENTFYRGTRLAPPGAHPRSRGENAGRFLTLAAKRAHPRSRGENAGMRQPARPFSGSSPLTRGKPGDTVPRSPNTGLIPAHAGKTRRASSCGLTTAAHPRSRGENGLDVFDVWCLSGSSPLTRGKLLPCSDVHGSMRLIPAHAGKTSAVTEATKPTWAHPRSRGENCSHLFY